MSRCTGLFRAVGAASVALLIACGRAPDRRAGGLPSPADALATARPAVSPSCYEGHDGPIAVTVCDMADPAWLRELRAGRWLPPRERALRAKSPLCYGRADSAAMDRASAAAKQRNSYIIPHFDTQHLVVGWDLLDVDQRLALLSLDLDDRWGLFYSDTAATNARAVRASLQRFLEAQGPIEQRARSLYPP
jgi:hypothetical protein